MRPFLFVPFALLFALFIATPSAFAASVSITNVQPTGGISAGTPVTFYAAANGFTNPTYSVSTGTIDPYGYFSWTPTVDDAGLHSVMVTVTDSAGHAASSTTSIYVIPNTIEIQSLTPGAVVYTKEPVTFTLHMPGFVSPWFTVRDTYAGSTITTGNLSNTGAFSWNPAVNEQGLHKVTITAQDSYGHQGTVSQSFTVLPSTVAAGSLGATTQAGVGTPVTFTASSVGLTNPTYSIIDELGRYSTVSANTIASTTGAFSWTPAASDIGTHLFTLTATDQYGSVATTKFTIVVSKDTSAVTTTVTATTTPATAQNTATVTAQNRYTFTTYLGVGSKGAAVTALQNLLTSLGDYSGPVTGYFGPLTAAGVKNFQKANGIAQVGFVGPQTRGALNAQ